MLGNGVPAELARLGAGLPFRPEIQIRSNRLAVYPGARNDDVDDVEGLEKLVAYARGVSSVFDSPS